MVETWLLESLRGALVTRVPEIRLNVSCKVVSSEPTTWPRSRVVTNAFSCVAEPSVAGIVTGLHGWRLLRELGKDKHTFEHDLTASGGMRTSILYINRCRAAHRLLCMYVIHNIVLLLVPHSAIS